MKMLVIIVLAVLGFYWLVGHTAPFPLNHERLGLYEHGIHRIAGVVFLIAAGLVWWKKGNDKASNNERVRKLFVLLLVAILGIAAFFVYKRGIATYKLSIPEVTQEDIYQGISYEGVDPEKYMVEIVSSKLASPTRIKLTPNGNHLLVSLATGELVALDRRGDGWSEPYVVTKVETKFPGFPPDEAGLTGIILSGQFAENGKIFLLYTFKEEDGEIQNRISVVTIKEDKGKLTGSDPKLVYQANIAGAGSHQITDGVAIEIEGKPHLVFSVGEGFDGKRAQNPAEEGGKIILIQEDGSDPLGPRPYSENPKVEAMGIRNAYVMAKNPKDADGRFLIGDSGPDKYDRLIYTKLATGQTAKPLNFGWDGDQDKLIDPIPDPNNTMVLDMVIFRLSVTQTFTGLSFLSEDTFLATMFGKTGQPANTPGKEISLGKITKLSGQPEVSFSPIVKRAEEAGGKLGNPIGLEIDLERNEFFFADIMEGRLYKVIMKDNE